jgi:16S rRNA (guanine527-N7)-methyltransferase
VEQNSPASLLDHAIQTLGLPLASDTGPKLLKFLDLVLTTNQTMNLTAITEPAEAVHKHLVDSLSVLLLKDLASQALGQPVWADIGSGAGFPGMVLALAVPGSHLHLVESTGKKAHFLQTSAAELGLMKRVTVHATRAEALAPLAPGARATLKDVPRGTTPPVNLRGACDAVFFRGVSKLASLVELGAPLLKPGGLLIAYKGPKAGEELTEAAKAMKELKMELKERKDFTLPGVNEARVLICLKKVGETPKRFPRPIGLAQKEPII